LPIGDIPDRAVGKALFRHPRIGTGAWTSGRHEGGRSNKEIDVILQAFYA